MSNPSVAGNLGSGIASRDLQALLEQLTREAQSGATCQVGNATITVRYCSNFWEWQLAGETFWDLQDLAEALLQGSSTAIEKTQHLPNNCQAGGDRSHIKRTTLVPLRESPGIPGALGHRRR